MVDLRSGKVKRPSHFAMEGRAGHPTRPLLPTIPELEATTLGEIKG